MFIMNPYYHNYVRACMMYCRKKPKKRKSGEAQPVFGVDSKDMRHGKEHTVTISIN